MQSSALMPKAVSDKMGHILLFCTNVVLHLFESNVCRWLEFESSGWRNEFRITYATSSHHRDPPHPPLPPQPPRLHRPPLSHLRTRTIAFPFVLTRDRWVKVGLVVTQRVHVQLYVDCTLVHEQRLDAPLAPPTDDPTHLWIGQRSRNHGYFKVSNAVTIEGGDFQT